MSKSRTFSGFPGFVMAGCLFAQASGAAVLRPTTSASFSWKGEAKLCTNTRPVEADSMSELSASMVLGEALQVLGTAALAKSVFTDSRAMEGWEKKATDDYFMSLFR